jgi:cystathionine beta-lyase
MAERFGPIPDDALPMWVADMDFTAPPCVMDAMQKRLEQGVFGYAETPESSYGAVSGWLGSIHGWDVPPSWVVACTGVIPAAGAAIRGFSEPGEGIVIQPPVYPPFFKIISDNGRRIVENPLIEKKGRYVMDLDDLERKLSDPSNKILLFCSPHNPVGRVWDRGEIEAVARICLDTGTILISDEIHSDIFFEPSKHIPVSSLDSKISSLTITCVSPSKTFNIPGLQAAFAVISDGSIREKFRESLRGTGTCRQSVFGLVASDAAYMYGSDWRREMLEYIRGNRDLAVDFFRAEMPRVKVFSPEGTYLLWLDFRAYGKDDKTLADRLINKGKVVLDPGEWFGIQGSGFQRLNLASPRSMIKDGLKRILSAFSDL